MSLSLCRHFLDFCLLCPRWARWWRETFRWKEERANNTSCFPFAGKPRGKRREVTRKIMIYIFSYVLSLLMVDTFLSAAMEFISCTGLLQLLIQALFSHCSYSSSSSNSSSKSEPAEVSTNTLINTFPRAPNTSDSIRLKCREMLANALQTGGNPANTTIWTTHLFT